MIVTEYGKFRYNRLLIGMWDLGDIFQAKVDIMIDVIKGVKAYINDISVLRKDILSNHIEQLRIIFGRLRASGLKLNNPNCSFGLKDITYLDYVVTLEGIKHGPKIL